MKYTIRHAILPSRDIYNFCGPGYGKHFLSPEERKAVQEKHVEQRNKRDGFFAKLEESVLREGFRNPVTVNCGYIHNTCWRNLPPHITDCGLENFLVCVEWGGSRLYIAQKHNLDVPCVIVDYSDKFTNERWLKTADDIRSVYVDKPSKIVLGANGICLAMDVRSWEK